MSVEIRPVDVHDEAEVRAFWEVERDAVADRPYNFLLPWETARVFFPQEAHGRIRVFAAAWDGDAMVGALAGGGPTTDNVHRAECDVSVHPDHRRRGIGTQLLEFFEAWARDRGRGTVTGEVFAPVEGTSPALEFATRHGFTVAIEDGMKVADIAETRDTWAGLAAECAPFHQDYEIRTVESPLPDELVAGYCAIQNMFMSEAPTGESDVEDEVWDEKRLRANEERGRAGGRRGVTTFAIAPDGEVAAMTELFANESAPHRGIQSGTLVAPGHRGHRLGLAVKVANQQALLKRFPELEFIITGNAAVNTHMNAINDRLGFHVVERCLEVEKAL